MATSPDISTTLWSIPNKKELLRKAFGDLEAQKETIARCLEGWKELDDHLTEMHASLEKRYEKIVEKEKKFEARMQEKEAALDKRESAIESREQASLARVQEQKDAAVAAIREQKRKWIEERQLLQNQSSAKPDLETTGSKAKQKDEKGNFKEEDGLKGNPKEAAGFKTNPKEDAGPKGNLKEDAASKGNPKEGTGSKAKKPKEDTGSTPQRKEETKATPKRKEETPKLNAKTGSAVNPNEESGAMSKPMEEKDNKPESEGKKDTKQETDVAEQNEETGDKQEQETDTAEESEDQGQTMEVEDEEGPKSDDEDGSDDAKDEDGKKHEDEGSQKKEESSQPAVKARPQLKSLCENMDGSGLRTFVAMQKKDINVLRKELPFALKCAADPSQLVLTALEGYYSSGQSLEGGQGKKFANRRSCITLLESLAVVLVDGGKDDSVLPPNIKEEALKIADLWKSKLNPKGSDQLAMLDAQSFLQLLATFGLAHEYDEDELCDLVVPICTRKHIPALWRKLGLVAKAPDVVDRLIKDGKQLDAVTYIHEYQLSEQFPPVPLLKAYLKDIRKAQSNKSSSEDKNQLLMKELSAVKAVLKCIEKYKLESEYPTEGLHKRVLQLERRNPEKKRNLDAGMGGSKKLRTNGPGGAPHGGPFRSSDRPHFGGRGMGGRNYGSGYSGGGRGGYPYPAGGPGYGSPSFPHGNYQYGGGPPSSYQGSYMR